MEKLRYTPEEIEERPLLIVPIIARLSLYADACKILKLELNDEVDASVLIHLVDSAFQPDDFKDGSLTFEENLKALFRFARKERAEEIGVTELTVRNWIKRHGAGILRQDEDSDEKLFCKLGMLQRREPNVTSWMNEYRKRRQLPNRSTAT